MSGLTEKHKAMIERLFEMDKGKVLGFDSNRDFKNWILLESEIDIEKGEGYSEKGSKAKKFRYFIENEPEVVVGKVLLGMLNKRKVIVELKQKAGVEDEYSDYISEIENVARMMCSGIPMPQSNEERLKATLTSAANIYSDILSICERLCNNKTYTYDQQENTINDYIRDMLNAKGKYEVLDQTRHGISGSGKDAGEVDILLKEDQKEVAIIEGLKLDSVNQQYIQEHIDKAIVNYNALGTPTYIIAYVKTANFLDFWNRLCAYLNEYKYAFTVRKNLQQITSTNAAVKSANIILSKDGYDFPLYFLAVNIGKKFDFRNF